MEIWQVDKHMAKGQTLKSRRKRINFKGRLHLLCLKYWQFFLIP